MKTLPELFSEALSTVENIALHPDFVALVGLGDWEDPGILLSDVRQALEGVQRIYEGSQNS